MVKVSGAKNFKKEPFVVVPVSTYAVQSQVNLLSNQGHLLLYTCGNKLRKWWFGWPFWPYSKQFYAEISIVSQLVSFSVFVARYFLAFSSK